MRKTRLFRRCGGAASLPHVTGSDTSTTSALIDCRPATTQETLAAPSSYQGRKPSAQEEEGLAGQVVAPREGRKEEDSVLPQ